VNATRRVVIVAGTAALAVALWYGSHRSAAGVARSAFTTHPPAILASAKPGTPAPAIADIAKPASHDADAGELVDICGVGKVRVDKDDPGGQEYVAALVKPAEGRWIGALQASSDPHARAAGLLLAGPGQSDVMAQLAQQNGDPALYDLALSSCAKAEHPGAACAQISPDNWAQLDADNAVPWLQIALRARLRGDAAREQAAIQRAAATHRIDDYNFSLYAYAWDSLPAELNPVERNALAVEAIGVETAGGSMQWSEALKYCSSKATSEVHVAGECSAIADLFESRGNTMLDLAIAKAIGAHVGWSKQRVEAATKYFEALLGAEELTEPGIGAARWSCGSLEASNTYLRDLARLGEIATLRERLERSGVSVPELAQQHRNFIEKLMQYAREQQASPVQPDTQ
jgi:hypothetical protein